APVRLPRRGAAGRRRPVRPLPRTRRRRGPAVGAQRGWTTDDARQTVLSWPAGSELTVASSAPILLSAAGKSRVARAELPPQRGALRVEFGQSPRRKVGVSIPA